MKSINLSASNRDVQTCNCAWFTNRLDGCRVRPLSPIWYCQNDTDVSINTDDSINTGHKVMDASGIYLSLGYYGKWKIVDMEVLTLTRNFQCQQISNIYYLSDMINYNIVSIAREPIFKIVFLLLSTWLILRRLTQNFVRISFDKKDR